jgi:Protein of unknown function (DUF4232)
MNAPFDPEGTHDGSENDDPFGENSMTWGAADPDFDRLLRERIGPLEPMSTPPYAFERVLLTGRRRRARKVWSIGAAAAFVVMAGTAGTTVALHGTSQGGATLPPAGTGTTTSMKAPAATLSSSPSPSPSKTPSASPSPSASASASSAAATTTSATQPTSVPQCHSDDLQLTVSLQQGGNNIGGMLIVLRNNSGHSCTVFGFPGLQTETENQQLQDTKVIRQSASSAQTLTLAQGDSVSTIAEFNTPTVDSTAAPTTDCGAPSYYLAVIPPNEQSQIVAPIQGGPVTVCSNGDMDAVPFTTGTSG